MFATAHEPPSSPSETSATLVLAMRSQAQALRPLGQRIERACLTAGERLGEAIPGLSELADSFDRLARELGGEAFAAATDELDAITAELARAAEDVLEEGRTLGQLAERNHAIGKRIEDLLGFTRTMSWLVFTLKIESAPLTKLSADMTAFAENIHRLAETTRKALDDYHATHFRLETLLRAARAAQARFQAEHQARLVAVAAELRENLNQATERRLAAVAGLRQTSGQTRAVVGRIGERVVALQIADRTRQRIEHAQEALDLIADALEGRPPGPVRHRSAEEVECLAARDCQLQARQLQAARNEYSGEVAGFVGALNDVLEQSDALAARGQALFGHADGAEGSFLADIEAQLIAAREAVAHFGGARAAMDEAAQSVVAIVEDMRLRTAALTDHIVDVTIIGTNALLRSTRLGDQGKGVALIARELRAYGEQTGAIIRSLPAALDGVVEIAAGLAHQGGRLDAAGVAGLQARMNAAIEVFGASHREIAAALARLAASAQENRERLTDATATVQASAGAEADLAAAAAELEETARRLGGPLRPDLDLDLDTLLLPAYTMDCEREIHADFSGVSRLKVAASRFTPRDEADLVDAILL